MGDDSNHDVRNDFQFISDFINKKTVSDDSTPKHDQFTKEQAMLAQAALHVGFALVTSITRIATALEGIEMNTRKEGMIQ